MRNHTVCYTLVDSQEELRKGCKFDFVGLYLILFKCTIAVYLLCSVDIFVESFEGINVELHELSKQIKVAL